MILKHKILILPVIVILLAGFSMLRNSPVKIEKVSLDKSLPLPVKHESKTQWTRPNWLTKFYKSFSPALVELSVIKINRPSEYLTILITDEIFYSTSFTTTLKDRSPPIFS